MEWIKRASGFWLVYLICLSLVAVPALADNPWTEDPPQFGMGDGDRPPGPQGGPAKESGSDSRSVRAFTQTGIILEISYRLAEFIYPDVKIVRTSQDESERTREVTATTVK